MRETNESRYLVSNNIVKLSHALDSPTPISKIVIYRSRNDRSFRLLEYFLVSMSAFILYNGIAVHRHNFKTYYNCTNLNFSRGLEVPKIPTLQVFVKLSSVHH